MARKGNERAWREWPKAATVAAVTLAILMTGAGVVLLYAGGEALVLGAVKLGQRVGMSPLVVGLTVVAFGTSVVARNKGLAVLDRGGRPGEDGNLGLLR